VKKRVMQIVMVTAALGLCSLLLFLTGCSERENAAEPVHATSWSPPINQSMGTGLSGNALQDEAARTIHLYAPNTSVKYGESRPYPVLYLLHDYGADHFQFETFNLGEILGNLVDAGEIKPMLVATIQATDLYGLGMYANSSVAGRYEDLIVPELISYIERQFAVHTDGGRNARAISGVGFGGRPP